MLKNILSIFYSKERKSEERANLLAWMVAYFHRIAFNNVKGDIFTLPYTLDKSNDWYSFKSAACYQEESDNYVVNTRVVLKETFRSEPGLLSIAAHEVRHRVQSKYPSRMLSERFIKENELLDLKIISFLKSYQDSKIDYLRELDATAIGEVIRRSLRGLNFEKFANDEKKCELIRNILVSSEENFNNYFEK